VVHKGTQLCLLLVDLLLQWVLLVWMEMKQALMKGGDCLDEGVRLFHEEAGVWLKW
jgi:hypothetical protein